MEDTDLRTRQIAGQYSIIGRLEDRGCGALYLAQVIGADDGSRFLLKQTRDDSEWAWGCFNDELACPIDHPHLAQCVGTDWISGNDWARGSWQVFHWPSSRTLATWLAESNQAIEPVVAVQLMRQICSAVDYLHAAQPRILHKHIAPESIGLTQDAEGGLWAYLREYGMNDFVQPLQMLSADALHVLKRGAPEQFEPIDITDERTDVYGIGATLYELVTGQRPLPGLTGAVARADVVNRHVPQPIANVIEQAMNRDARLRFNSVAELSAALEEAIRPPPPGETGGFWVAVAVALLLMVVGIWWITSRDNTPAVVQATPEGAGAGGAQPTAVVATPLPPTATPDIAATLTTAETVLQPIAGPLSGELSVTTTGPSAVLVGGSLADMAVEAVFVNPDTPAWNYGFAFRHSPTGHFRLSIASDGTWLLTYRTEDPAVPGYFAETTVSQGATTLALGAGETNQLRLVAVGPYGVVTINGQPTAPVGLSIKVEPGNVFVAAGLRVTPNAAVVGYRDLFVRGPQ